MTPVQPGAHPALPDHEYFRAAINRMTARAHRIMFSLLLLEWAGLLFATLVSGPHEARSAALEASALAPPAMFMAWRYPLFPLSRHLVAITQILLSFLLSGMMGTHMDPVFLVFGSLAFLAVYRDWRVLLTASALIGVVQFVLTGGWRQPMFGALWILPENAILFMACRRSMRAVRDESARGAQLFWDANHDLLTGLPNRRMLRDHFAAALRKREAPGALLFIDLDKFKQANDTLGHSLGDKLLALVAKRLLMVLKPGQALARVGGDEFVAFLNETDQDEAVRVAAELVTALRRPFRIDQHELLLSASVGISLYPEHGTELAVLQERADKAMYAAKAQGRDQCAIFSSEVVARERMARRIEQDLYLALPQGQFRLCFQPLLERSGRLIGFEALLRWQHPTRGLVPPVEFIPLAEKSGLIIAIGEWALAEACRHCKTWQRPHIGPIGVSVNVSAVQFEQDTFPLQVMSTLDECAMNHSLLTLELTEGMLIRDIARTSQQLEGLRASGVRVALDDFGTGYSSLSYLTTLPVDSIKLDRSFINRPFPSAMALVASIVDMAHGIGLKVVAEGVETLAQTKQLIDLNCDEMQGLCFSGPIPAEAVAAFVEAHFAQRSYLSHGLDSLAIALERLPDCPEAEQTEPLRTVH